MRHDVADFDRFWSAAALQLPIIVVGGGRWGQVWTSVIAKARGNSRDLAVISHGHADDMRRWAKSVPLLNSLKVFDTFEKCNARMADSNVMAVVASRPRDHLDHAETALNFGWDVLIEKPIGNDPDRAQQLLKQASLQGRIVGVATEFSYLPALHHVSFALNDRGVDVEQVKVIWNDPDAEKRYGRVKRNHHEVNLLEDLTPHFISLILTLVPDAKLRMKNMCFDDVSGELHLNDSEGRNYFLNCDKAARERIRNLLIAGKDSRVFVDFTSTVSSTLWNGKSHDVDSKLLRFNSTLRLELGAFQLTRSGLSSTCGLSLSVPLQIELQRQIRNRSL